MSHVLHRLLSRAALLLPTSSPTQQVERKRGGERGYRGKGAPIPLFLFFVMFMESVGEKYSVLRSLFFPSVGRVWILLEIA
jgi:hypothetical protein